MKSLFGPVHRRLTLVDDTLILEARDIMNYTRLTLKFPHKVHR